jgi:outer membrane protein assembly factor BamB
MAQVVRQYYSTNQVPLAQTPLKAQEVDILQWVSPTECLVGTIELGGIAAVWSYNDSEFILIDGETGKAKWALPRKTSKESTRFVVAVDPVIIIKGINQKNAWYHAVDKTNGNELWSHEVSSPEESLLIWGKGLFLLVSSGERTIDVTALDVKSGKTVWEKTIEDIVHPQSVAPGLTVDGDGLILASSKVIKLALADGRVVWNTPASEDKAASILVSLKDSVFVAKGNTVTKIDARTGAMQWMTKIKAGNVKNVIAQPTGVYVVAGSTVKGATDDWICALKNTTGKELWSVEFEGPVWSNLILDNSAVYATGLTNIYAIKSSTGAVKFRSPLPDELNMGTGLPDILQFVGPNIIIARESGVAAVGKDGKLIFKQALPEGHAFTYDYLANKYAEGLASVNRNPAIASVMKTANLNAALFRAASPLAGYNSYQKSQASYSDQRLDAQVQFGAAIISSVGAIAGTLDVWALNTQIDIFRRIMIHSIGTHLSSIQGGYYARPFYRNGWYLAVVNLKTGGRADLLMSPVNEGLRYNALNLPSYSIDSSSTRIVIKGIESDPSKWTTYQKLGIYRFWSPAHLGKMWTIPYPSILTYNITQLKYNTYDNTSSPVMKKPTSDEKVMIQAAFTGDYARVKSLLDAGVSVNAADEYGHTALMHAALMMNYKMEKLLLERGADVTQMDHGGYTAIYFRTFPFRPVDRSLYVLDKKYKALPKDQTVIQE